MIFISDTRLPSYSSTAIAELGAGLILLPADSSLPPPVASHTDLSLFVHGGVLIARKNYYNENHGIIDEICHKGKLSLRLSDSVGGKLYPLDCSFCAFVCSGYLFCREASTDREILNIAKEQGLCVADVAQGYAKCSSIPLCDGGLITSDASILRAAVARGIDCLFVGSGDVTLPGYSYGFIGGASGVYGNRLYFVGDATSHKSYRDIFEFCKRHGTQIVSLGKGELYDVGSLLIL